MVGRPGLGVGQKCDDLRPMIAWGHPHHDSLYASLLTISLLTSSTKKKRGILTREIKYRKEVVTKHRLSTHGQILRRWHKKAANRAPSDVPSGHVAVYVGRESRRYVIRTTHLNHPLFRRLLVRAEEEYKFANQGSLVIPCDESLFKEVLGFLSRLGSGQGKMLNMEDFQRCCHMSIKESNVEFFNESLSLVHRNSKSVF